MGAYATDVVEKLWPTNYGGRGTPYLSEGGFKMRDQYGNFSAPPQGYIWDFAKRAGVSVRSYGEFAVLDAARRRWCAPTFRASKGWCIRAFRRSISAIQDQRRGRYLARGVPEIRARRDAAATLDHPYRQRSHAGHDAGCVDAARDGRRQRPRARPHRRGDFAQPLLEGVGDLRHRGRRAERAGPRRRAPLGPVRDQPVLAAALGRFDALLDDRACCGRWS